MGDSYSHRDHRFVSMLGAALLVVTGPTRAIADSAVPPPERSPSVSIDSTGLRPSRLTLGRDQRLLFYNDSESVARVELDLEHGRGINCLGLGGEVLHGRKFVVAPGTVLDCEGPTTNVDYRVFLSGSGAVARSEGRIELDRSRER